MNSLERAGASKQAARQGDTKEKRNPINRAGKATFVQLLFPFIESQYPYNFTYLIPYCLLMMLMPFPLESPRPAVCRTCRILHIGYITAAVGVSDPWHATNIITIFSEPILSGTLAFYLPCNFFPG